MLTVSWAPDHAHNCQTRKQPMNAGDQAPDFKLNDQFGREVALADFKGRCNVMLLFYPLDWTPT